MSNPKMPVTARSVATRQSRASGELSAALPWIATAKRPRDDKGNPTLTPLTVSHPDLLTDGSDDAFRGTLLLLVSASSRLQTCREAFGRAMGLTGSQFTVLLGVAYRQGSTGVSINDLAAHIQLAPTHATTEVGRLTRRGLLTKRRNQTDGRGRLVSLSQAGEAAVRDVAPFVQSVNDLLFEGVSRAEWAAVAFFLNRFAGNGVRALELIARKGQPGAPQRCTAGR